jgi:hypothetical protein
MVHLGAGHRGRAYHSQGVEKLAATGSIAPATPIRRTSLRGSTHWMRAGKIKELFLDNVVNQLGPPICDDCGATLPNITCAACNTYQSPLLDVEGFSEISTPTHLDPQPPDVEPAPEIEPLASESQAEPPNIQRDINVLRISARTLMSLTLILVGIFVTLFANDVIASGRIDVILGALASVLLATLVACLAYVITMTFAKALRGLLDKAEKADHTEFNSRSQLVKSGKHR